MGAQLLAVVTLCVLNGRRMPGGKPFLRFGAKNVCVLIDVGIVGPVSGVELAPPFFVLGINSSDKFFGGFNRG